MLTQHNQEFKYQTLSSWPGVGSGHETSVAQTLPFVRMREIGREGLVRYAPASRAGSVYTRICQTRGAYIHDF